MRICLFAPLRESPEVERVVNPVANHALLTLGFAATMAALVLGGGL